MTLPEKPPVSNSGRVELLELLAQAERSVEELAAASRMDFSNTSALLSRSSIRRGSFGAGRAPRRPRPRGGTSRGTGSRCGRT